MASNKKEKGKFSLAVIRKVIRLLKYWIAYYMANFTAENLKLCVSRGNKKIGHVLNVSLAPIITCGNCAACKYWCYDIKAVLAYPSAMLARARNTAIFKMNRDVFFGQLYQVMRKRKTNKYLRFHVSGEIVDYDHFDRMVKTAIDFPDFRIWTYTKMYWIVNEWINKNGQLPENFSVMFSEWKGVKMDNPHNLPVFTCAFDEKDKAGKMLCPGNCNVCKEKKTGCIYRKSAFVLPH